MRFVPVPYEALDAIEAADWVAVTDLYKRAHSLRWQSFEVTERSLMSRWQMSGRKCWRVVGALKRLGLLDMTTGSKRNPTLITVFCPTEEVQQLGQQLGQQNGRGLTGDMDEGAAQEAAQEAALLTRHEKKQRDMEQAAADFVVALAIYNDVRTSFDQPMNRTKLRPSKGQGLHLAQLIKAEGLADVIEVFQWWATAQDQGLRGGAAFHRAERSTIETMRRRFDGYLDKARNPYKASPNGSSNGSGLKAEAAAVLGKINVMIRDPRWNPADLGDSEHAEAARAGLAACGGIDDFRRSRDEIGDRIRFVAGYLERRSNP
jgi:hypothetical protein